MIFDREQGTYEWIDPDAPAPFPVATTSEAAVPAAIEAPPSAPTELRVEVPPSSRGHSPLSLSQVAGVESPLTPVFGLEQLMDVDAPAQPAQPVEEPMVSASSQDSEQAPSVQNTVVVDEGTYSEAF